VIARPPLRLAWQVRRDEPHWLPSLAVAGDLLLHFDANRRLCARDLATGAAAWTYDRCSRRFLMAGAHAVVRVHDDELHLVEVASGSFAGNVHFGGADLVGVAGDLLVGLRSDPDHYRTQTLSAVDLATGRRRWTVPLPPGVWTPRECIVHDPIVVLRDDDVAIARFLADGGDAWRVAGTPRDDAHSGDAWVLTPDGSLHDVHDGGLRRRLVRGGRVVDGIHHGMLFRSYQAVRVSDGMVLTEIRLDQVAHKLFRHWDASRDEGPVVTATHLFFIRHDGPVAAVDRTTGALDWTDDVLVDGQCGSLEAFAVGRRLVVARGHQLSCFDSVG
jgi:outer membrane protein assembly factor BamB